ncbi:hypothetical protein H0H87_011282 [Tephrocybe sp. NHM501043]|nr:hypothetical protein H0H87_011282 [Tephrocybe sp. NHM501043]
MPHLTQLSLESWRKPDSIQSKWLTHKISAVFPRRRPQVAYKDSELTARLEYLGLDTGRISRPQLLFFAGSPSLPSSLQAVAFRRLQGLTNADVLAFLAHISPTIEHLSIRNCEFSRSEDEEHAIDAIMPRMTVLRVLDVSGDLISDLAVSRKTFPNSTSAPSGLKFGNNQPRACFDDPDISRFTKLSEALAVTGWVSVTLRFKPRAVLDPKLIDAATRTAIARGIKFDAKPDDVPYGCYMV